MKRKLNEQIINDIESEVILMLLNCINKINCQEIYEEQINEMD